MTLSYKAFCLHLFTAVFFTFSILLMKPISAQEGKDKNAIQHEVTVTVKLIQVYVIDKKGNPVIDLGKDDFVVYEDGKKQLLTEFEKHILLLPSLKEEVQPKKIAESKIPAPRELMSRKFFLLFDFAYNNARGILRARKAALHFLDTKLQPTDEVAVLSYSAIKSLTLHEYLTTDHKKVRDVVDSFGLKKVHGRAENLEQDYWSKMKDKNPLDISEEGKKEPLILNRIESLHQAANFAQKMKDLAKALRYIPGQKHILLFSSGIPYSMMYRMDLIGSEELRARLDFEDMLKELAASNSKIYILDTEDLAAKIGIHQKITGVFSLQNIASSTGGKYLGNINSYEKHMEEIQKLTGCYYVLGYYVDEKWDGKYHKIKVKVNRPGCEVHAQKGYFNPKPFAEYSKLEKTLHLVDLALNEDPLFQTSIHFSLSALACSIKRDPNLVIFSEIPVDKIQDLSGENLEIATIIFDKEDNIVKIKKEKKNFSDLPQVSHYYSTSLALDPGEYKCRVVIRNLETGKGAVGSSSIKIPEFPDYGLRLDTPLLLKRERNASYLRESSSVYPFESSLYSPLVGELERGTKSIFAVVRCSFSGIQQPDIQFSANLIHHLADTGKNIPATLYILNRHQEEGTEIFLIELQTEGLQPGEYSLYLFAVDGHTQSFSRVNTAFKVK
jgi:VWFA-related protein